jgi:hypothetical protein
VTLLVWSVAAVIVSRLAAGGLEAVTGGRRSVASRRPSLVRRLPGPLAEEFLALGRDRVVLTVQVLVPLALLAAWQSRIRSDAPEGPLSAIPVLAGRCSRCRARGCYRGWGTPSGSSSR